MPAMINDWRLKWSTMSGTNNMFPFGLVQISVWGDSNNGTNVGLDVAIVRMGQTANYGM